MSDTIANQQSYPNTAIKKSDVALAKLVCGFV